MSKRTITKKVSLAKITVIKDGPYKITGGLPLDEKIITEAGGANVYKNSTSYPVGDTYHLCRCGDSANKPFCDGVHVGIEFDGTETATKSSFKRIVGPDMVLLDDHNCAYARMCHREHKGIWELTLSSNDPKLKQEAITAATLCPTGRLVALEMDGRSLEPYYQPSISVLQDPQEHCGSAIMVRGAVELISAEGEPYPEQNRKALCRCGRSKRKPFCDASHVRSRFKG